MKASEWVSLVVIVLGSTRLAAVPDRPDKKKRPPGLLARWDGNLVCQASPFGKGVDVLLLGRVYPGAPPRRSLKGKGPTIIVDLSAPKSGPRRKMVLMEKWVIDSETLSRLGIKDQRGFGYQL
jgi:hypothetical protein